MILAYLDHASATELGARALGRGGVGFADVGDPAGEQLNLAASSLVSRYTMFAGAELGPDARILVRGGAVDSRTSAVAVGAGYRWLSDDVYPTNDALPGWKVPSSELENPTIHQGAHVGVAVPFLDRRISIAGHARFDWRSSAISGADDAFNFGFSAAAAPVENFSVALGAFNLLDTGYERVSREGILGIRYQALELFGVEVDGQVPLDATIGVPTLEVRAGVDVRPIEWLELHAGWAFESEHHFIAGGVAFRSGQASLDYGIRIRPDSPSRNWHALDVRVEF